MRTATHRLVKLSCAAALATLGTWAASGCILDNLPDRNAVYSCKTTADCAGDGFVCVALAEGSQFCCRPSPEQCDGKDNDCNGKTDDLGEQKCYSGDADNVGKGICREGIRTCNGGHWSECFGEVLPSTRENCNGLDDDCDGQTDEDYDFNTSDEHCGRCNSPCSGGTWCANGKCTKDAESCSDNFDNDRDGTTDCFDTDCPGQPCKPSPTAFTCDDQQQCSCHGVLTPPAEKVCDDHFDSDCDGLLDCADPDCEGGSCGAGCVCKALAMTEVACDNTRDDDGDGSTDCNDADCAGASCGTGCECDGTKKHETDCTDGVDNDGDFKRDCIDEDCIGESCSKSGGGSGVCANHACN
ncbi:MAG: MopE-related protein [Myxococcales bacterium]